ncbi:hypothetical protein COB55_02640 [Candidatus Wolfebacteria bacterium]|nr:MAG: hypothetical protein COB55_02640 [Candidatus Wolfebacteria bacterium]
MKFQYKAVDSKGNVHTGVDESVDKFTLARSIKARGGTLITAKEAGGKRDWKNMEIAFLSYIKEQDKVVFARNLGEMLDAGLPLSRALTVLERQSKNKGFQKIIAGVGERIQRGDSLHISLENYPKAFSSIFVSMVRAGEESGNLSHSLIVLSKQMERTNTLKKKIRGAMLYPGIILTVMFAIGILMFIFIVPTLVATFKELDVELPITTQIVIGISNLLQNHTILFFGGIAALISGFIWALRTKRGHRIFDYILLRTPIIKGLVRETNSARTARTLSSLLGAGVEIVHALGITGEVLTNTYFKEVLKTAEVKVQKGTPISAVFIEAEDLFPVLVGEMMNVGEETGKISEMLENLAHYYEEEVDRKTKDMSTIVEPVLMVIIGISVGFFAISMITPIYSLLDGI